MRYLFFDPIAWDYDPLTPTQRPLGGSQSALCYLTQALAKRGHQVAIINGVPAPREVEGVRCYPLANIPDWLLRERADAVIVLNGPPDANLWLRAHLRPGTPLLLWNHHAADQPAVAYLGQPEIAQLWDHILCVSDWQREELLRTFPLERSRMTVLRNAITPAFTNLFASEEDFVRARRERCILAYSSTPFRGLSVLLDLFPRIHDEFPDVELQVYSSMGVYQVPPTHDEYRELYDRCRSMAGVSYLGSVSQRKLAEAFRSVSILSYPNTFAETSCIAAMEAMAAGAAVVSTELGALPETTQGFATLVPPGDSYEAYVAAYTDALRDVLTLRFNDPEAFARRLWLQVQHVHTNGTWSQRAEEWEQFVAGITGPSSPS